MADAWADLGEPVEAGPVAAPTVGDSWADLGEPGPSYGESRRAEAAASRAEQKNVFIQTSKETGTGLFIEAPKRVWESATQAGLALREQMGMVPEGTTNEYTKYATLRRYAATGGEGVDEGMADFGEFLGTAALGEVPGFLARGIAVKRGLTLKRPETWWRAVRVSGRQGAAQGAFGGSMSEYDDETITAGDVLLDRLWGTAMSAGMSSTVAGIVGARAGVRNFLIRQVDNAEKNNATVATMKNAWNLGTPYTLSQRGGSALVRQIEMQVAAAKAQNYFNDMFTAFAQKASNVVNGFALAAKYPGNPEAMDLALRVQKAWRSQKDKAYSAANDLYGKRTALAITTAANDAEQFPVPVDSAANVVRKWAQESGGTWWRKINPGTASMAPELAMLDDYFKSIDARNTKIVANGFSPEGISVTELIRIRRGLNNMDRAYYDAKYSPGGPSPEQLNSHHAISELRAALDEDIDRLIASSKPPPNSVVVAGQVPPKRPAVEALEMYRAANRDYQDFTKIREDLDQSAVGQMFGFRISDDPEKAILTMAGKEPSQQRLMMQALKEADGGKQTIRGLQLWLVQDAMRASIRKTGPAVAGTVDPDAFADALLNRHGNIIGSEIFSAAQRREITRALDTIRIMQNAPIAKGKVITSVSRAPEIQGTVMAIVSLSEAFMARAAIRASGLGPVEKLLFSKEGLQSLEVIRQTYMRPTEATARAVAQLTAMIAPETREKVTGDGE